MDQLHHQHQQQLQQLHGQIHQLQQQLLQQQQQNPQNQTLQHQEEDDNDQGPQVVAQQEVVVEAPQGGLQQVDAEVGEQGPPPVDPPPVMSDELKKAIRAGDILKIISRLDAGESPNSVTSRGSAAISALRYGDLGAAKVLYGWGADLSTNNDGNTLLHIASWKGNLEHINWVLNNATIDVNSADDNGNTPVMMAIYSGHIEAVKLLLERGADLSIANIRGFNALHFASAGEGNLVHIDWLFDNATIDVNSTNSTGRTPLSIALYSDHLPAAKFLVEKGGDIFMKNNYGERAIDVRVGDKDDGIQLGPEVLEHAKALRRSSIKEFLLLSKACQSSDRRKVATIMSMDDDLEGTQRSARLAASVLGDSGISRMIGSFLLRTDLIIRDKSIPLEADAVKRRVEEAISSGSSSKRARLD